VEQDLALFTAKRGRPPSSIAELYPDESPPFQLWDLPYMVKLEDGEVVVQSDGPDGPPGGQGADPDLAGSEP
jgi:hypothetical protein